MSKSISEGIIEEEEEEEGEESNHKRKKEDDQEVFAHDQEGHKGSCMCVVGL